jgi:hypothetical protein
LTAFLAVLVFLGSLINTQGDRYVDMAVPLWAAVYAVATLELAGLIRPHLSRLRKGIQTTA